MGSYSISSIRAAQESAAAPRTSTVVEQLLGDLPLATFMSETFGQAFRSFTGTAAAHVPLADWTAIGRLVEQTRCDRVVVRDGKPYDGAPPTNMAEARALFGEGYSLMFRGVDAWDRAIGDFGRRLAFELQGRLNLHVYATPKSRGSFGWHHDPEDVFIVQTAGRKRYTLRENTTFPNPVLDRMGTPAELAKETTPSVSVDLSPGDVLYIPPGMWHTTEAIEDSLSISVGLLRLSYVDLLDLARAQLLENPQARTRLPPLGLVSAIDDTQKTTVLREQFEGAAAVLRDVLLSPAFPSRVMVATAARAPHAPGGPDREED